MEKFLSFKNEGRKHMSRIKTTNTVAINKEVLEYFVGVLPNEVIGKTTAGDKTTVKDEFSEIAKLIGKAKGMVKVHYLLCHPEDINLYNKSGQKLGFKSVEQDAISLSDYEKRIGKHMMATAKKIIWFSSVCEKYTGETILESYVDLRSRKSCQQLVKVFSEYIDNVDAFAEGYESVM